MGARPSEAIEDYAKAIYSLCRQGDGTAGTNALAERLGVTPASVSAMVKKLDERGLVRHVRYKGVALTPAGERVALEVMRHHRLLGDVPGGAPRRAVGPRPRRGRGA